MSHFLKNGPFQKAYIHSVNLCTYAQSRAGDLINLINFVIFMNPTRKYISKVSQKKMNPVMERVKGY